MDLIDVLDENGLRTGEVLSRIEIHSQGKWHRAIHLYLFNSSNALLMQKRSQNVDHFKEFYSISLTGHVNAGESSYQALKRELKEELGLHAENLSIQFLFSFKQNFIINSYIDNQFNDIYACFLELNIGDLCFDKHAIIDLKIVSLKEIKILLDKKDSDFAKIYANECKDVFHFLKLI